MTPGRAKATAKASRPGRADDLLNSYLKLLSQLDLFTAEEEREQARLLRRAEVETWSTALGLTASVDYLLQCEGFDDFPALDELRSLERCYLRGGMAEDGAPRRAAKIERRIRALAEKLRDYDSDRLVIERLIEHLRGTLKPAVAAGVIHQRRGLPPERPTRLQIRRIEQAHTEAIEIRNRFVRANLRLVVSVARSFHHYRLPLVDLIQEGNLGLIKAVHRFDFRKGFRFSTYAHWWIRQSIERAIVNKGAQVRLPVHIFDTRRQVNRATRTLMSELGRSPSNDEIADFLDLPVEKVAAVQENILRDPVSIHDIISDDDDRNLGEVLHDPDNPAPDEAVMRESEINRIRDLLALLSPIEMDVICRRFGLLGDNDETLEEIGRKYNLSRERVRQIQVQGLKKMRRFCERREIGT